MTNLTDDLDIIQALEDLPNDTGTPPLSAAELKEKFDTAGNLIKTYINTVLLPEIVAELAAKMAAPDDYGVDGQYLQSNGDGTVDVSDYIGVANHILGNTPAGFNARAADVNNDNVIDVSDYIGVANIILTGSIYGNANARSINLPKQEEQEKEPQ